MEPHCDTKFCAPVTLNIASVDEPWDACVLRTVSRLQRSLDEFCTQPLHLKTKDAPITRHQLGRVSDSPARPGPVRVDEDAERLQDVHVERLPVVTRDEVVDDEGDADAGEDDERRGGVDVVDERPHEIGRVQDEEQEENNVLEDRAVSPHSRRHGALYFAHATLFSLDLHSFWLDGGAVVRIGRTIVIDGGVESVHFYNSSFFVQIGLFFVVIVWPWVLFRHTGINVVWCLRLRHARLVGLFSRHPAGKPSCSLLSATGKVKTIGQQ